MDLGRCTPQQLDVVTTVDKPLMVSAGAGSGKTFTLTQRIVYAMSKGEGGKPFLDSIDEVCAITFTKKAAAELRSRIKSLLVQEGFLEQAKIVDGAWISTIHGMASRILRENALELGIDPAFEVIDEAESSALLSQAAEMIASEVKRGSSPGLNRLFETESIQSNGSYSSGSIEKAKKILSRAYAMPNGLSGIRFAKPRSNANHLLTDLAALGRGFLEAASEWENISEKEQAYIDQAKDALARTDDWLSRNTEYDFSSATFDVDGFRSVLYSYPTTTPKFHAKNPDSDYLSHYRSEYARIAEEAESSLATSTAIALIELAHLIDEKYSQLKGCSRFDNNDLLQRCYSALKDNPSISEAYRRQFKMIMVDEFQDTDRLQLAVIEMIAQPNMGNVCTVGDAQQSIYRFRGADVNVFLEYKKNLVVSQKDATTIELPDNFRSHSDVLSLVDKVFAHEEMFGVDFLHLEPKGNINAEGDALFRDRPRVLIDVIHYKNLGKEPKISSEDSLKVEAEHIAAHFAELISCGEKPEDMALLLGAMKNSGIFADALRRRGIESMVIGGSTFSCSAEANLVAALLMYARNRKDDAALVHILTSDMFSISDDVLLLLSNSLEDEHRLGISISRGFIYPDEIKERALSNNDAISLGIARSALGKFVENARRGDISLALRGLFVDCGYLDRLQEQGVQGLSTAGNIAKACDIVADMQEQSTGIATMASLYMDHLAHAKEKPGVISGANADYVSIMSVHASKGLEFSHVVVAELGNGSVRSDDPIVENIGDTTYVSKSPSINGEFDAVWKALQKFDREDENERLNSSISPGGMNRFLKGYRYDQELSESKRLLYVALTRAVRSVMLSIRISGAPASIGEARGLYASVWRALEWPTEAIRSSTVSKLGNGSKFRIGFEYLPFSLDEEQDQSEDCEDVQGLCVRSGSHSAFTYGNDQQDIANAYSKAPEVQNALDAIEGDFLVPHRDSVKSSVLVPYSSFNAGLYSYTSLSNGVNAGIHEDLSERSDKGVESYNNVIPIGESSLGILLRSGIDGLEDGGEAVADELSTDLGIAFHRLAQKMILIAGSQGNAGEVPAPSDSEMSIQAQKCGLSIDQEKRLKKSVLRWTQCDLAKRFFSCSNIRAEVPFCQRIDFADESFYLRGEIDGLADIGNSHALLIDYKTGGLKEETQEHIYSKHLFQAQCYAYALLSSGYNAVEANFIRVEQCDPSDDRQPQVVTYRFDMDDMKDIRGVIVDSYDRLQTSVANHI